jgi:hypothetical protein
MFNDGCFLERLKSGKLHAILESEKHPSPFRSGQPQCTWSQFLILLDENDQEIARVHQYKRPDGSIGASGRPDPKRLIVDGIIYYTS